MKAANSRARAAFLGVAVPCGPSVPVLSSRAASQSVVFGIRPEHVRVGTEGFPARVTMAELLGHDTLLHLSGPVDLLARVDSRVSPQPGTEVRVAFDADATCLFDPESGRRLGVLGC